MKMYEQIERQFKRDTRNHEMKVLHADGLYRHLRFNEPGTYIYGFDIVTWPGYLTLVGDVGEGYTFSRIEDMFEFFASDHGRINPAYWSEKLTTHRSDLSRSYSHERLRMYLHQWARDYCDWTDDMIYPSLLIPALDREILGPYETHHAEEARERIELLGDELRDAGEQPPDPWEWDFRDFNREFLWCCHAIAWGVAAYRALPEWTQGWAKV